MAKDAKGKTPEAKTSKKTQVTAEVPVVKEAKAVEPKKEEPKKEEPKKEAAVKKTAGRTKKTVKEKTPMVPELFVQYDDTLAGGQEANVNDIVAKVKALYVADGHRESSIKSLQVYLKPQEWKAYYVINGKIQGEIQLF